MPTEARSLSILTDPSATVTLLLLGDALDASLDQAVLKADAKGRATVTLTAPSVPSAFVVRAQVGTSASAELHVAVSELGFTTITVVPKYDGKRMLTDWSADILVGTDCALALASYPEDPVGALHAVAPFGELPTLESVPVGPQLAVAVRSGSLVAGCVAFAATKPEGSEEVAVEVLDRPMLLDGVELDVSLELKPADEGYGPLMEASVVALADAAFPPQAPFAPMLLDAIEQELSPTAADSLIYARELGQVDQDVSQALAGYHANQTCLELKAPTVEAALADAQSETSTVEGRLAAHDGAAMPTFALESFGGLLPAEVGAPEEVPFAWNATADDVLVMSGTLPISATRLAGAFMNAALSAQLGQASTVPAAIASAADCAEIATVVGQTPITGCDTDCLEAACQAAIESLWANGLSSFDSVDGSLGNIQIAIAGDATIDSELAPTAFAGTWLGTLAAADKLSSIAGEALGEVPPPP